MVLKSKLRIILSKIFLGYEILEISITTDAQHSTCPSCTLLQWIVGILSYPYKTAKSHSYEVYARYIDPSTGIYTSNSLSEDIKPGVDLEHTLTGTTDISVSPAFPYNQLQIGVFYVPDDYPSIQAAVDAASAGDTIIVRDGTYTENVDIDKSITLKSSSGNPGNTIVQAANPNDHVFAITADYVNIRGFTVGGVAVCIFLNEVNYCNISNNHIFNNTGIYLNYSNDNIIMNNNFSKSDE